MQDLFVNRNDCYTVQQEGKNEYIVVKKPLAPEIISGHLAGLITIGVFQINPENNKVKWICFDFDGNVLTDELEKAKKLYERLLKNDYHPLLEFSGRRGYHVWLFIESVDASVARMFAKDISVDIDVDEIFPKQDKIEPNEFGGQVKLPLGIHRVSLNRSYFLNNNFTNLSQEESKKILVSHQNLLRDKIRIKNLYVFS